MKTVTIECFAGISGDMLLGALIDLGVPADLLRNTAVSLGIGAELHVHSVQRSGIRATKVDVLEAGSLAEDAHHHHEEHGHAHGHDHNHAHAHGRNWPQIRELIAAAPVSEPAKAIAQRAFALLAEAESKIHGIGAEEVHFHEVGAVDTIADIVCASVGAAWLATKHDITAWRCSAVNTGSGYVNCAHGRMPVPAPATAELLQGLPIYASGPAMELTTPTGVAMLRALGCIFEPADAWTAEKIGYGAGSRDPQGFANVLRLCIGTAVSDAGAKSSFPGDRVVVLECAVDDATPQVLAYAMELALEQGALDVMAAGVTMKKGRLGTLLTVLCRPDAESAIARLLFRETTTLGIRRREEGRAILDREFITVDTRYGKIRIKIASVAGEILNAMPEYEDCRRAAREQGIPLRAAMEAALAVWTEETKAKA